MGELKFDRAAVQSNYHRKVRAGLEAVANQIVENAQGEAPVRTGFLKENIKVAEEAEDTDMMTITVRSGAPYSKYQEEGTAHHGPQPFFEQAYKGRKAELRARMVEGMKGK